MSEAVSVYIKETRETGNKKRGQSKRHGEHILYAKHILPGKLYAVRFFCIEYSLRTTLIRFKCILFLCNGRN